MPLSIGDLIFVCFVGITFAGAIMAVSLKNIFHNALSLALTLLGTAGIFVFLHCEFLGLMQILIYAGAISIAIIFAVMLSPPLSLKPKKRSVTKVLVSLSVSTLTFVTLAYIFIRTPWPISANADAGDFSATHIGEILISRYAFAFELISIVLLVAILGALVIAHEEPGDRRLDPEISLEDERWAS
ncbi:MAG: NADH-quinone oxidoreductase subunit J [Candidatus Omnitrophica bacterium]|nr:NADH-quinone oxidoreductase subunit J [Candidatus Omnitrophota bacterium]